MKKKIELLNRVFIKLVIFLVLLSNNSFAEIDYKEIKAKGVDKIYEVALKKAFKQAITKVNGITIESENLYKSIDANVNVEGVLILNNHSSSGEYSASVNYIELQKTLYEKSEGSIRSFKILNEYKGADGNYYIEILASIAQYKLSKEAQRKRIATIPFRIKTNNFFNYKKTFSSEDLVNLLNDDLTTYFVQTNKFTVLDRKFDKEISDELINLNDSIKAEEQVKIGQKLFADYILTGEIQSFKIEEKEKKFLTSDVVIKKEIGKITLNFRVLNVVNGQIIFSSNFEHEIDLENISQPLKYFSNQIVEDIGVKIISELFPIMIGRYEENLFYLNQGGEKIKPGDLYSLYHITNKSIIDSYTGESLGYIKKEIGIIEIIESNPGYSVAKFSNINSNLDIEFSPLKFIAKPYKNPSQKNEKNKKKKKVNNLEKVF